MDDVTFLILKVIVSIAVALITSFVIPYLKEKLEDEKYKKLLDIISAAVLAAEQTINESGAGKDKKAAVVKFVSGYLDQKGIKMTEAQLDNLIEAAVYSMNNAKAGGNNG